MDNIEAMTEDELKNLLMQLTDYKTPESDKCELVQRLNAEDALTSKDSSFHSGASVAGGRGRQRNNRNNNRVVTSNNSTMLKDLQPTSNNNEPSNTSHPSKQPNHHHHQQQRCHVDRKVDFAQSLRPEELNKSDCDARDSTGGDDAPIECNIQLHGDGHDHKPNRASSFNTPCCASTTTTTTTSVGGDNNIASTTTTTSHVQCHLPSVVSATAARHGHASSTCSSISNNLNPCSINGTKPSLAAECERSADKKQQEERSHSCIIDIGGESISVSLSASRDTTTGAPMTEPSPEQHHGYGDGKQKTTTNNNNNNSIYSVPPVNDYNHTLGGVNCEKSPLNNLQALVDSIPASGGGANVLRSMQSTNHINRRVIEGERGRQAKPTLSYSLSANHFEESSSSSSLSSSIYPSPSNRLSCSSSLFASDTIGDKPETFEMKDQQSKADFIQLPSSKHDSAIFMARSASPPAITSSQSAGARRLNNRKNKIKNDPVRLSEEIEGHIGYITDLKYLESFVESATPVATTTNSAASNPAALATSNGKSKNVKKDVDAAGKNISSKKGSTNANAKKKEVAKQSSNEERSTQSVEDQGASISPSPPPPSSSPSSSNKLKKNKKKQSDKSNSTSEETANESKTGLDGNDAEDECDEEDIGKFSNLKSVSVNSGRLTTPSSNLVSMNDDDDANFHTASDSESLDKDFVTIHKYSKKKRMQYSKSNVGGTGNELDDRRVAAPSKNLKSAPPMNNLARGYESEREYPNRNAGSHRNSSFASQTHSSSMYTISKTLSESKQRNTNHNNKSSNNQVVVDADFMFFAPPLIETQMEKGPKMPSYAEIAKAKAKAAAAAARVKQQQQEDEKEPNVDHNAGTKLQVVENSSSSGGASSSSSSMETAVKSTSSLSTTASGTTTESAPFSTSSSSSSLPPSSSSSSLSSSSYSNKAGAATRGGGGGGVGEANGASSTLISLSLSSSSSLPSLKSKEEQCCDRNVAAACEKEASAVHTAIKPTSKASSQMSVNLANGGGGGNKEQQQREDAAAAVGDDDESSCPPVTFDENIVPNGKDNIMFGFFEEGEDLEFVVPREPVEKAEEEPVNISNTNLERIVTFDMENGAQATRDFLKMGVTVADLEEDQFRQMCKDKKKRKNNNKERNKYSGAGGVAVKPSAAVTSSSKQLSTFVSCVSKIRNFKFVDNLDESSFNYGDIINFVHKTWNESTSGSSF